MRGTFAATGLHAATADNFTVTEDITMKNINLLGWSTFTLALALAGGTTFVLAQGKPGGPKPTPDKSAEAATSCDGPQCDHGGGHGMHECPMMKHGMDMPALTVSVENTAQGATLKLIAKNSADVSKVQEMAQKIAKHMQEGCPMMKEGGMGNSSAPHGGHQH